MHNYFFKQVKAEIDISLFSFIDLLRNISLAVFAISTWYIAHEEKRVRILLKLSLTVENKSIFNLAEMVIELRDEMETKKILKGQVRPSDIKRLKRKIRKLRKLDYIKTSSVIMFSLFVFTEMLIFIYYLLT